MPETLVGFVSPQPGDAAEFVEIVQNLVVGLVREQKPKRLYVIRIDNWFGPRWLHFAGKFSVGSSVGRRLGLGVHKARLHVPPFVPARVITERVFAGQEFSVVVTAQPLHIDCPSKVALKRRIEDVDKDAVFVWFSSESKAQGRGVLMVHLPVVSNESGFYAGFARSSDGWQPSTLRHVSRSEVEQLVEHGRGQLTLP